MRVLNKLPKFLMGKDRRELKIRLCEAQNWHCCYCGVIVSNDPAHAGKAFHATFEHVIPMAQIKFESKYTAYQDRWYHRNHYDKRYWNYETLVIACQKCNSLRKTTDAYDFFNGELWKPENKLVLRLWHMKRVAVNQKDPVPILKVMGNFCRCNK